MAERIAAITAAVDVPVIFHGHNNLGLAVANSIAAVHAGASMATETAGSSEALPDRCAGPPAGP